jgi:hypothetical protein
VIDGKRSGGATSLHRFFFLAGQGKASPNFQSAHASAFPIKKCSRNMQTFSEMSGHNSSSIKSQRMLDFGMPSLS